MNSIKLFMLLIVLSCTTAKAQLSAGDIAFIGMNTDATEGYSFITLTDIPGNDVIFFSDRGIINSDSYILGIEGTYKFTAPPAGIPCGTIVGFNESSPDTYTISGVAGATMTLEAGSANLGSGDQVYAYQTAGDVISSVPSDATFIAGIMCDYDVFAIDPVTKWTLSAEVSATSESIVPPGLTNGINCLSVTPAGPEKDNMRYSGTLTGTSTFLRAEINDYTNWETNDGPTYDLTPAGYSSPSVTCVAPCSNPTIPTLTYSPTTFCEGEATTLTISGALNDATAWHVYTGSCGGTEIGSTGGSTFEVTPESPSTTYYIRGEGGCVSPSSCGSVLVTITPTDDASFNYDEPVYCPNGSDPTPSVTLPGGSFTFDPAGLTINAATGEVDLSASDIGTYTITYSTDGDCPANSDFTLTIADDEAPIPDLVELADIVVECEVTSLTNPSATDNCTDPVIVTHDASLPMTEQGVFTVTWTYDDGNGNTTEQTQTIIIEDISGPVPTTPTLDDITAECEVTTLVSPSAVDNCSEEVIVSSDADLPITEQGTTTITWTYFDVNGNSTTQTQDIVINDITSPTPSEDPLTDIVTSCELYELPAPEATDNCGAEVSVAHDAEFPISEPTTVIWTYDDGNGNTSTQSQNITFAPIDVSTTTDLITITATNSDADSYQWVDCNDDFSNIDGETTTIFTASENGEYAVIITEGACSDTSDCITISNVNVHENELRSISVYPNPIQNNFFNIKSNIPLSQVWLIDMGGRRINVSFDATTNRVALVNIDAGFYMLALLTESGQQLIKEVIILE